jgi:hypothetical protein
MSMTGNAVYCDDSSGIRVGDGSNVVLSSNVVTLPSAATGNGFNLSGTIENIVVANNTVRSPSAVSSKGINIGASVSGLTLKANNFQDCTTPVQGGVSTTIASGVISISGDVGAITVDTEGAGASDDLDTINGGVDRQILVFRAASSSRDVVFKDATGNMRLAGDFTLTHSDDTIVLMYIGTVWYELSRSDNTA